MNPRLRTAALAALALVCGSPALHAMDTDHDSVPDDLDALPCDPLASQVAFAPAKDAFGMVMFEDLWPAKGDGDYNDSIIAYNYVLELASDGKMVGLQGTFSVLALGASVHNGIYLGLPVPASTAVTATLASGNGAATALLPVAGESGLVFRLTSDGHQLFGAQSGMINTQTTQASRAAQTLTLVLRFGTAQSIAPALAPYDLYLQRPAPAGYQIHRPEYAGTNTADPSLFGTAQDGSTPTRHYVDRQGLPFALNVPVMIRWPLEGVSIDKAYPDILAFGSSGGTTHADWYLTHVNTAALWSVSPEPVAGPVASWPLIDTSCLNVWKGTIEYGGTIDTVPLANKVDAAGNVYSTGYRYATGENSFLAKFSPAGTLLWLKDFTSSASNGQAYPSGLAVDAQGNLFTTGYTYGTFGGATRQNSRGYADLFISKFDSSGNLVWNRQVGARYGAFGVDVVSDGAGGVYAVGYSNGDFNGSAASFAYEQRGVAVRLSSSGSVLWARAYDLGSQPRDSTGGVGIGLDGAGNLEALFWTYAGSYSTVLAKLDPGGALTSSTVVTYPYFHGLYPSAGVINSDGTAAYTGYYYFAGGSTAAVGKIKPGVGQVFLQELAPSGGGYSFGFGVATASNGDVVAAGATSSGVGGQTQVGRFFNSFVARYTSSGSRSWVRQLGVSGGDVVGASVCVDSAGSAYLSGWNEGNALPGSHGNGEAFIAKYSSDGTLQ